MKKTLLLISLLVISFQISVSTVYAVCPVCTVAVGAGLELSRVLGVDDAVTSIWIGGLILSSGFWFIDWLSKRYPRIHSFHYKLSIIAAFYIVVVVPLIWNKTIGLPYNKIFGIDKIIFGTIIGSLVFFLSKWADEKVRKVKGHQLFNYQRVIFPITLLFITSIILDIIIIRFSL